MNGFAAQPAFEREQELRLRPLHHERHCEERIGDQEPDQDRDPAAHDPEIFLDEEKAQGIARAAGHGRSGSGEDTHAAASTSVR